ncbi:MAG: FAD-dependent oxidoreductase [Steroidobacteraceae bacterium]
MQRDLGALDGEFEVLIIGGGIYGACLARTVAQAGFSVALLEKDDFGGAVSHNSLKIVHGGFRYIQHFDLPRIWESVAAQRAWLSAAPHLVQPMRCVIPAYGYGTRGPMAFAAGICAFHAVAGRRNAGLSGASRLPRSGVLSRRSLLSQYPQLAREDLTGGAYWYDAQMLDANRLTLECLQDAGEHGAIMANHVEVLHLCATASAVEGAVVRDNLTGREFEVRARVTINATGPFVESVLKAGPRSIKIARPLVWTRNVNIVTRKLFAARDAVGVGSRRPSDAAIGKSQRLFFVTSWQDCSVVGTSHTRHQSTQHDIQDDVRKDVADFIAEVNEALPQLDLDAEDVRYVHSGLTPAEDDVKRSKRSTVIDHEQTDGVRALITVLGIKYTTAPIVAASVIPIIQRLLQRAHDPGLRTEFWRPLPGRIEPLHDTDPAAKDTMQDDASWARRVYGARAYELFSLLPAAGFSAAEHTFRCRVLYGIQNEMVMRLRDAVLRATDLAERGCLTRSQLEWCADTLATRFSWSEQRRQAEIDAVLPSLRLRNAVDLAAVV